MKDRKSLSVKHLIVVMSLCLGLGLVGARTAAMAAGSPPEPARGAANPNYIEGEKAIKAKDFAKGAELMQKVINADPKNANAWNWLGYSFRNLGQFDKALSSYDEALRLDPAHLGAHEYIGETYIKLNRIEKAKEHLQALTRLCPKGCEELDDLRKAIDGKS